MRHTAIPSVMDSSPSVPLESVVSVATYLRARIISFRIVASRRYIPRNMRQIAVEIGTHDRPVNRQAPCCDSRLPRFDQSTELVVETDLLLDVSRASC